MTDAEVTAAAIEAIADAWGIESTLVPELTEVAAATRDTYRRIEALAKAEGVDRSAGTTQGASVHEVLGTDSGRAWMYRARDAGTLPETVPEGPLAGRRLAVKDCIAVAGVPMTLGGSLLSGFVPTADATAVARARSAGARFEGTTVCEDLCMSGSSFTSVTGPVPNPFDAARAAGGSSSGSAAVVARNEADLALGTDLGGSVRNPAAWCGIAGLKPTFGVVPYTGAMATELSMDHLGLMARTVEELIPFLIAVAGPDDLDPRQAGVAPLQEAEPTAAPRIGVVREGFAMPGADPRVDAAVHESLRRLGELGAEIREVSIPLHRHAPEIHVPIATEGGLSTIFEQSLQASNHAGAFDSDLAAAFGAAVRDHPADLPLNAKATLVVTSLMRRETGGSVMALAQRLRRKLRAQYDHAFAHHDVLAMPATPALPHRLPGPAPLSLREHQRLAFEMHDNHCAQNLTGHPALTIPCAVVGRLPVGLLLIGRHLGDLDLLVCAERFQRLAFPPPTPDLDRAATT